MKNYKDVDSYIKSQSKDVILSLQKMREIVRKLAPKAQEGISYGMPAYKYLGKPLVYFSAQKSHLGFYPTPSPIKHFEKELASYKTSKGAVQIPFDQKLPVTLMTKMIKFRLSEIKNS